MIPISGALVFRAFSVYSSPAGTRRTLVSAPWFGPIARFAGSSTPRMVTSVSAQEDMLWDGMCSRRPPEALRRRVANHGVCSSSAVTTLGKEHLHRGSRFQQSWSVLTFGRSTMRPIHGATRRGLFRCSSARGALVSRSRRPRLERIHCSGNVPEAQANAAELDSQRYLEQQGIYVDLQALVSNLRLFW